ncbi:MAG TPA: CHAT domain-containing protein [Herpetosiphonaceae bacterium]|nr:CHAT domain-containing protein [Herpetosiphonaceae bacterium]
MARNSGSTNKTDYLDFELEIGAGVGRQYPVAVVHSPAGEVHGTMHFPFDDLALDNQLKGLENALLRSGGRRRKLPSEQDRAVQDFGKALYDALLVGEIRTRFEVSRREAAKDGKGLRLKLRFRAPEMASLPWEFLYDEQRDAFISFSRRTPIVRYIDLPEPIPPLAVTPPLRILAMVVNPKDQEPLDVTVEQQRVEQALKGLSEQGLVELQWLQGTTSYALQRALQGGPWHIFHFVGHGGFDPAADEGVIALADQRGQTDYLSATALGRLLGNHFPLRVAILNSCEGARGSKRDVFSSTAAILVRQGTPAVLAMQYPVSDIAAIEFSHAFYDAVSGGLPIDAAVSEGRLAVSLALPNSVEWGTPVLYMRSRDGRIFDIEQRSTPTTSSPERPEAGVRQPPSPPPTVVPSATVTSLEAEATRQRLKDLYTQGLSFFYTKQWDKAVPVFQEVVARAPAYEEAAARLAEAERQQRLIMLYAEGKRHFNTRSWDEAIKVLQQVTDLDPAYADAAAKLEEARRRRSVDGMYEEARRLHKAQQWQATLNVLDRIREVDQAYPDADRLSSTAREGLRRQEREQALAAMYDRGLNYIGAGDWQAAYKQLEEIQRQQRGYRETEALLERARSEIAGVRTSKRQQYAVGMLERARSEIADLRTATSKHYDVNSPPSERGASAARNLPLGESALTRAKRLLNLTVAIIAAWLVSVVIATFVFIMLAGILGVIFPTEPGSTAETWTGLSLLIVTLAVGGWAGVYLTRKFMKIFEETEKKTGEAETSTDGRDRNAE